MLAALIVVAVIAILAILVLSAAIKVLREYERGVIFRLGRLLGSPKGPGLIFLIPIVDRMVKVDLRTITLMIPPQEVITKDNVPARVNAVCYFRVVDASASVVQVENFMVATSQVAQTTLRSVLGQHSLDELLSEREKINSILQEIIDETTAPWGIKVSIVEVKDVEIPADMQRAMARQAEAERERRAKIINAEGEFQAAERLKEAALVMGEAPIALQLRYLQTLLEIGRSQQLDDRVSRAHRPVEAVPRARRAGQGEELSGAAPELRRDPLSGRLVVVAPDRARRPGAFPQLEPPPDPDELDDAPSAQGERTGPRRRRCACRRTGDWRVRVVPNLYPAFERQEVVVHTPEHVALDHRAVRRSAVARGRGVAFPRRGCACGGLCLRPRDRQRGQSRRREPPAHALAAHLASRAAAGRLARGDDGRGDGRRARPRARRARRTLPSGLSRSLRGQSCSGEPRARCLREPFARGRSRHGRRGRTASARGRAGCAGEPLASRRARGGTSTSCRGCESLPASSSARESTSTRCRLKRRRRGCAASSLPRPRVPARARRRRARIPARPPRPHPPRRRCRSRSRRPVRGSTRARPSLEGASRSRPA